MIKANELRIGNWISSNNIPFQVYAETCADIEYTGVIFEPIPLTPEILEKAGFKEAEDSEYAGWISSFIEGSALRIRINGDGVFYYAANNYYNPVYIKSLHQLQNLYFALTGEELEIKL